MAVHAREELNRCELRSEALAVDETLYHAHDARFEIADADCSQYFFDAFCRLRWDSQDM